MSADKVCVVFDRLMDDNHVLLAGLKLERAFEEPFTIEQASARLDVRAGLSTTEAVSGSAISR